MQLSDCSVQCDQVEGEHMSGPVLGVVNKAVTETLFLEIFPDCGRDNSVVSAITE